MTNTRNSLRAFPFVAALGVTFGVALSLAVVAFVGA